MSRVLKTVCHQVRRDLNDTDESDSELRRTKNKRKFSFCAEIDDANLKWVFEFSLNVFTEFAKFNDKLYQ